MGSPQPSYFSRELASRQSGWPLARAMAGFVGIQARVVKTEQVQLDDISLASDSGWRDVDPHMVAQLKEKVMQGEWGADHAWKTIDCVRAATSIGGKRWQAVHQQREAPHHGVG